MTPPMRRAEPEDAKSADLLLGLARAQSRADVVSLVRHGARRLTGAEDCLLLALADEPAAAGEAAPARADGAVLPIDREGPLGRAIAAGEVIDIPASHPGLAGLPLAPAAAAMQLVPCSGPGSTLGLCLQWREAAGGEEIPRALAAAAGMAIDRLDAIDRERMARIELQSRIRNVVATVRSVSTRSADRAESLGDYMMHFEGRLDAMARPYLAFARSGPGRLDLEDLLRGELLAEGIQEGPRVALRGMPIGLARGTAELLGLAFHELAVNCVKFGPLSGRGGDLSVRWWSETGPDRVSHLVEWRETSELPAPRGPYRVGFGRDILERALPYETGAETDLAICPYTLTCSIAVPDREQPVR